MQPDSDCLVVGAGLVGCVAAIALARAGYRVTVVEQREQRRPSSAPDARALVLSAASRQILANVGIWPALTAVACPIRHVRVSDRGGFGSVDLNATDYDLDAFGWSYPAHSLREAFVAAMIAEPNVTVAWDSRFLRVESTAAGQAVRRIVVERETTSRVLTTSLLLGADGSDSAVRAACDIATRDLDFHQQAIVARVTAARPRSFTAFEHFTRSGPLALLPTGGNDYVSVQCVHAPRAAALTALADSDYCALLERRLGGRLGAFSALGQRRVHRLVRRRATAVTAPRTIILGNAATTVHPNGAQGLNLGLRDVAALVHTLTRHAVGSAAMLQAYSDARLADHNRVVRMTDLIAQTFSSRLLPVAVARRAALAVLAQAAPWRRELILEASGLAALARIEAA